MKEYIVKVYEDSTEWFNKEGQRHREGAPAVEWHDGSFKSWWLNGECHREDGAAVECANGYKRWYLNGRQITEEEFNQRMNKSSYEGKEVEIDGKKYILTEVR